MTYYCHLDSVFNLQDTNLQLYSLKKAAEEWNGLIYEINEVGCDGVNCLKERLVFITNCFGLSISQLIGQNSPSSTSRIDSPSKLLPNLLKGTDSDDVTQKRLKSQFVEFLKYYDALRHFGKTKYNLIEELTLTKLDHFRSLTIEIWNLIITKYRKDKKNDIDDFSSISELICFKEITNKSCP